jgi:hypothetical protein
MGRETRTDRRFDVDTRARKHMHMDSTQIEEYVNGRADDDVTAYVAHLSLCLHCAERIARRSRPAAGWERRGPLGRLVPVA